MSITLEEASKNRTPVPFLLASVKLYKKLKKYFNKFEP